MQIIRNSFNSTLGGWLLFIWTAKKGYEIVGNRSKRNTTIIIYDGITNHSRSPLLQLFFDHGGHEIIISKTGIPMKRNLSKSCRCTLPHTNKGCDRYRSVQWTDTTYSSSYKKKKSATCIFHIIYLTLQRRQSLAQGSYRGCKVPHLSGVYCRAPRRVARCRRSPRSCWCSSSDRTRIAVAIYCCYRYCYCCCYR